MRISVIASTLLQVLVGTFAVLWLLWGFIPGGKLFKGTTTLLIIFIAAWSAWAGSRSRSVNSVAAATEFPTLDTLGPIVLVCGDNQDALFQGKRLRQTAQGWWLRVDDVSRLTEIACALREQQPRLAGQLSVMYACYPDLHTDEAGMRAPLKTLREQVAKLEKTIGFSLPVCLCYEFSGARSPWLILRGDSPLVCLEDSPPVAMADWQSAEKNSLLLPMLNQAMSLVRQQVIDELEKSDRLRPPVKIFAIAMRTGVIPSEPTSVWSDWLYRLSYLRFPRQTAETASLSLFPDALLSLLFPFAAPVQGGDGFRRLVFLLWFCVLAAIGFSAVNNGKLIHEISADLQRWHAIPMNHYFPKSQALASLKQDALLLERWQRQGEPYRYGLGYYPGQRLWLAVQQAIDTWVPPPASEPEPAPQIVRLDSMSLFDSGKAVLKPGSTKMLVASLVGIKAKPGWLILIGGHTDNTGSYQLNQTLSLQRAIAVRDWMRDTGDVPESCFAVQGYGASRPVAPNDTPEGRAQNRRVEISLVPQADACRLPDITSPSSQEGDGFKN